MRFIHGITVCILLMVPAHAAFAQPEAEIAVSSQHVAGNVYMLVSEGSGNMGVSVGDDGLLIVDDKFADLSEQIQAALNKLSAGELKFVLNTHWHGDHTGGNEVFGHEAVIIAHKNVRKRLSTRQEIKLFNMISEPKEAHALPVITFDRSVSIHFNGEEIKVLHLPAGHTDGDSVIFFTESNVVHLGDHFFNGIYPFIDVRTGGSVDGTIANIRQLLAQIPADAKLIPGHGPLATKQDLKAFLAMLEMCSTIVRERLDEGKSLEAIQEAGLPEDLVDQWGQGFLNTDAWLKIIVDSHTQ